MKAVQLALNASFSVSRRVSCSHEQNSGSLPEEARGYSFQGNVQFGSRDCSLAGTVLSDFVCEIHSGGEEHPSGPSGGEEHPSGPAVIQTRFFP